MNSERGSFSLVLVTLVTPIIILVSLVTIGLSQFYYQQQIVQSHLDQASILAVKSLPNVVQAKDVVDQYLESKNIKASQRITRINSNQVSLSYESDYQLKFSDYFSNLKIPLKVFSSAEPSRQKIHLIIDTSSQVPLINDEYWPTAQFIDDNFDNYQWDRYAVNPNELTSKCFNQEINLIKLVALELVDYFYVQQQGHLTAWTQDDKSKVPIQLNQGIEINHLGVADYCLAAAWNETFFIPYQFPAESNAFDQRIDLSNGEIKPEYLQLLSLQERIWGLSQMPLESFDLNNHLEAVLASLVNNSFVEKNLKIIILANHAPRGFKENSFQTKLAQMLGRFASFFDEKKVSFYYLLISNQHSLDHKKWQEQLENLASEFANSLAVKFILTGDEKELSSYVNSLINDQQSYVLLR